MRTNLSVLALIFVLFTGALAQAKEPFAAMDVFKIAYAGDPVVSPRRPCRRVQSLLHGCHDG